MNTQHLRLPYNIPPPPPLAPLSPIKMDPSSASWRLPTPFQFPPHMIFPTVQCEELYNASLPLDESLGCYLPHIKYNMKMPSNFDSSSSSVLNLTALKSEIISPVKQDAHPSPYSAEGLSKPCFVRTCFTPTYNTDQYQPTKEISTVNFRSLQQTPAPYGLTPPDLKPTYPITQDLKPESLYQPTYPITPPNLPKDLTNQPPVPAKKTQCRASTQVPTVTKPSLEYTTANELFLAEQWKDLQTYIATTSFPESEHQSLQKMWFNSVYEVYTKEKQKKTKLTPALRYRLRKQQPVPVNISSVIPATNNHFTDEVRSSMEQVFYVNSRPGPETVKMLVETTGLTAKQIRNFFKNKRQRS